MVLPLTKKKHDSIMVVVDQLINYSHFIHVKIDLQGCQCCRNIPEGDISTSWSAKDGNF